MARRGEAGIGWGTAIVRAVVVLVATAVLFVIVPDRLLAYLTVHLVPFWRDALMLLYVAVAFVAGCVLFVRLQGART
jgi:hypothetical protein